MMGAIVFCICSTNKELFVRLRGERIDPLSKQFSRISSSIDLFDGFSHLRLR